MDIQLAMNKYLNMIIGWKVAIKSSIDKETNEKQLVCKFEFKPDDNVTAMVEDIFGQFDDSNNDIDYLTVNFGWKIRFLLIWTIFNEGCKKAGRGN